MNSSEKNNMAPLKLGVTGGVGSGKSVVSNYLAGKGFTVISADELSRQAVMPGTSAYKEIVTHFGDGAISNDGGLDRKKLRNLITKDPQKKKLLESFIHPEVFRLMAVEFDNAARRNEPIVVVEVPLLFEVGLQGFFDFTLTVCAEREVRIKRIMHRDKVTYEEAEALIGIQMPDDEKKKMSDFVIDNNGTQKELSELMEAFYQKITTIIQKTWN